MRGRKIDSDFLSQFISECVSKNISSTEDIVRYAKSQIDTIDSKIREAETLKRVRGNLIDAVSVFEKQDNSKKNAESKILPLFKIQNQHICKLICDNIKDSAISMDSLYNKGYSVEDIIFCVKQLLWHKVISKVGNYLLRGELFGEYVKFVLKS
jgi:hypothetical protein